MAMRAVPIASASSLYAPQDGRRARLRGLPRRRPPLRGGALSGGRLSPLERLVEGLLEEDTVGTTVRHTLSSPTASGAQSRRLFKVRPAYRFPRKAYTGPFGGSGVGVTGGDGGGDSAIAIRYILGVGKLVTYSPIQQSCL